MRVRLISLFYTICESPRPVLLPLRSHVVFRPCSPISGSWHPPAAELEAVNPAQYQPLQSRGRVKLPPGL